MTNYKNKLNKLEKLAMSVFFAVILTAFAVFSANAQTEQTVNVDKNEQTDFFNIFDLTGTWEITITPGDGEPFIGYYSFNSDGNASFSSAGPPIPALGNPGYGVWKKVRRNHFAATIKMNSYSEDFQFAGTLKINARIQMTSRNTFVTQDTVTVFDPDGNIIVVLGGTAQGRRMIVED